MVTGKGIQSVITNLLPTGQQVIEIIRLVRDTDLLMKMGIS